MDKLDDIKEILDFGRNLIDCPLRVSQLQIAVLDQLFEYIVQQFTLGGIRGNRFKACAKRLQLIA